MKQNERSDIKVAVLTSGKLYILNRNPHSSPPPKIVLVSMINQAF